MNLYDITVITPDKKGVERVENHLKEIGGEIKNKADLGVKPFSYPINKALEGVYTVFKSVIEPSRVIELEKNFRLDQNILRSLIVKTKSSDIPVFSAIPLKEEKKLVLEAKPKPTPTEKEKPQETAARQKALNKKLEEILKE